jgi:isoleucyl-tRNA synthetase
LSFTTEEIFKLLFKDQKSIHLEKFIEFPDKFKNQKLNEKWTELIKIRNICNISIEEKRANKEIGSSLEADLKIQLSEKLKNLTENTDFSELCITSKAEVSYKEDIETTAITSKANGSKCSICWKIKEKSCERANCAVNSE